MSTSQAPERAPGHLFSEFPMLMLSAEAYGSLLQTDPSTQIEFDPAYLDRSDSFRPLTQNPMRLSPGQYCWFVTDAPDSRWVIAFHSLVTKKIGYIYQRNPTTTGEINTLVQAEGANLGSFRNRPLDGFDIIHLLTEHANATPLANLLHRVLDDVITEHLAAELQDDSPTHQATTIPEEEGTRTMSNAQNTAPVEVAAVAAAPVVPLVAAVAGQTPEQAAAALAAAQQKVQPAVLEHPGYSGWKKAGLVVAGAVIGAGALYATQRYLNEAEVGGGL